MTNAQKTPLARTLPLFAKAKALDEIIKRGLALPGHVLTVTGSVVKVAFDVADLTLPQVTMALAGPEYIRYPIQAGDLGVALPASTFLGPTTGLGQGKVNYRTLQANLSTLFWVPLGNKGWTLPAGADANTLALYGKLSLLLLDSFAANASVKLTANGITLTFGNGSITMASGSITITYGSHSIVLNNSGITIDGKVFLAHMHTGVTTGTGTSGGVA